MPRSSAIGGTNRQSSRDALQRVYETRVKLWKANGREEDKAVADRAARREEGESIAPEWRPFPDGLAEATGDPLAVTDPSAAARLYGLAYAPRPKVAVRKLAAAAFGDAHNSATEVARRRRSDKACWAQLDGPLPFKVVRSKPERAGVPGKSRKVPVTVARSDRAAAEMAVALLATRGTFIGAHAPVAFSEAVDLVRKAMNRPSASCAITGGTGDTIHVVPAPGMLVPMPDAPGSYLPSGGMTVPDTAFWRRRVADGDCIAS